MRELPGDVAAILNPPIRAVYNKLASKVSNLSEYQISRLSDEDVFNLVEDKFSNLSESESTRIFDAVLAPILYSIFPRPRIRVPKDKGMSKFMTLLEQEDEVYESHRINWGNILLWVLAGFGGLIIISRLNCYAVDWLMKNKFGYKVDIVDPAQDQLKLSMRTRYVLPKPRYARSVIAPKGLKGVGEPYIRQTNMVHRQVSFQILSY